MPTLEANKVRLALDKSSKLRLLDAATADRIEIPQGAGIDIECAVFDGPALEVNLITNFDDVTSVQLIIRAVSPNGAVLLASTIDLVDFDSDIFFSDWEEEKDQQFTFSFDADETALTLPASGKLPIYFVVRAITPTNEYNLGFGYGEIVDIGIVSLIAPVTPPFSAVYVNAFGNIQNVGTINYAVGQLLVGGVAVGGGGGVSTIVGITGTIAQFNTALTDGDFSTGGGTASGTNTGDNAVNTLYSGLVSNATHIGDATGATALTVVRINGISLGALATGILKNTTITGQPSIAIAADFPTLNQNTTGNAATVTTNANLTGHVTSVGNATVLGGFTVAQLNTAISDADVATGGGTATGTNTGDQTSIVGISGTLAQFNTALSDGDFATQAYADSLVVGLLDDRGNHDASGNVFPSSGGSGTAGAVLKGDLWTISVGGTLGGTVVTAGDVVRAIVDTPGQTAGNWAISENNFGYVALNQALASGLIYVGNGSGIGTAVAISGDITMSNAGVVAIGALKVTSAMLNSDVYSTAHSWGGQQTFTVPVLGTPASGTLTNCTGLSIASGVSGLAANIATFLATPSSANLLAALTDETGTGANVFATSPTLVTPLLGTPTSGVLTNCTGTAAGLTAGNVTTNANLTGHVTSVGNAAVLGSFTLAQLNAAISDANIPTAPSGGVIGTATFGTDGTVSGLVVTGIIANVAYDANGIYFVTFTVDQANTGYIVVASSYDTSTAHTLGATSKAVGGFTLISLRGADGAGHDPISIELAVLSLSQ